jgi:plastocyanin
MDTIHFQNDDAALHNIDITKDKAGANSVYKTDFFQGPGHKEYQFQAPAAGKYFFHCDVHPQMVGTVTFE